MAALCLAVGAGVGLAVPAQADTTGFTGSASNYDEATDAPLTFGGTLEAGSSFTSIIEISNGEAGQIYPTVEGLRDVPAADCDFEAGDWDCSWNAGDALHEGGDDSGPTESYLVITQQDADGTTSQDVLTYDVIDSDNDEDDPGTFPTQDFQFAPGAVSLTTSPTDPDDAPDVGTTFYQVTQGDGDTLSEYVGCPSDVNSDAYVPFEASPGPETCSGIALPPGEWSADGEEGEHDSDGYFSSGGSSTFFTIPDAPQLTSATRNTNGTVTLTGTGGVAGQNVEVLEDGNVTAPLCTVSDLSDTTWSCSSPNVLKDGTYSFTAVNQDVDENAQDAVSYEGDAYAPGGLSAQSNGIDLVIKPATTVIGDVTPVWSFTIEGDTSDLQPGDVITVTGTGLPAGSSIDIVLHSNPVDLGTYAVGSDGTFTQSITIPANTIPGAHQIIITATGPGLVTTTQNQPLTLHPKAVKVTTSVPTGNTTGSGVGSGVGGGGQVVQPNILTNALTPIGDVATHPSKIVSAIEIGLVLLLLAVLPAHLLNATIAEQSDRFERRFRRFPKRPRWLTALAGWFTSAPVGAGIVVTLLTAILFGFADPKFGWTLASLRLVLAAGIALFLVGYVANKLTAVIARNQWQITVLVNTRPYGLILTIVGVLVSRLLHFSPGFLIGLILGLTIQGKSAAGFAWRTVVTRTCIVLAMGIAAWIGYSTLTLGGTEGGTFWTALMVETLVAITTEGVVALLVELLPLRFLEGERVYAHSRALWGILYFLTVVVFVIAVIPWEGNWSALGSSLWIWLIILAAFAVVCLAVYVYFRRFAKPLEEEAGSEEVSLGETVESDHS